MNWRPSDDDQKLARIVASDYHVATISTWRDRYHAALLGIWTGQSKKPGAAGGYLRRCAENAIHDLLRQLDDGAKPKRPPGRPPKGEPEPKRITPLSPQAEEEWRDSALEYVLREYGTPNSPGRLGHRRSTGSRHGRPAGAQGHGPDE